MKWADYYIKIEDWAVSTAVNKISALEDMGTPDEVVNALLIIGFEDERGATRLLNKALQCGMKFSGENLVEISDLCTEESFKKALYQSADSLTAKDLEDMYGCLDDELILDLSKRYGIAVPRDMADEYEEELCPDASTPIAWKRFYDAYNDWNTEYAAARAQALTSFGSGDEVIEVINNLFCDHESEASGFITKALAAGVKFNEDNLLELTWLCNEETVRQAVLRSGALLTEDSLEELYGNISDDTLIQVAKAQNIRLPEGLREEGIQPEDLRQEICSAIDAANYALECLEQARLAVNNCGNVNLIDKMNKGFLTSLWKHSSLSEADAEMQQAQSALAALNTALRGLSDSRSVRLKYSRLASMIDMWLDDDMLDALQYFRIEKARKRIEKVIKQVENIRQELLGAMTRNNSTEIPYCI